MEVSFDEPQYHWMRDHGTLHIPDIRAQNEFPQLVQVPARHGRFCASLFVRRGKLLGVIARRTEVRPFTPAQIKLLETFADQAVIAIENVRLFQELTGVARTADGDERNFGRYRQLADRYSAGAGCGN